MSTGPLCRVCHTAHWTREPHAFIKPHGEPKRKTRKAIMQAMMAHVANKPANTANKPANKAKVYKTAEKRRTYMRELMRTRRKDG